MSETLTCDEKMAKAFLIMELFEPLYAVVFLSLNKVKTDKIPTMGVGPYNKTDLGLYYNPKFVDFMTVTEVVAVLKHEALHILLNHIVRTMEGGLNPKMANIAQDMAINCHIENLPNRDGFKGVYPSTYGYDDYQSSDWYYAKLKQDVDSGKIQVSTDGGIDDHSLWDDFNQSGVDSDMIKDKCKSIADKAVEADAKSKSAGNHKGNLIQQIIAAHKHVINWKRELRWFISRLVQFGTKTTRSKPNRRYDLVYPGRKKQYISRILVALDTSGSVSDKELQEFVTEVNGMISHVSCDVMQFDHDIQEYPRQMTKKITNFQVRGRGGTSFQPVVTLAEERGYDGLIIMTDGFAPFPNQPKHMRVMWCLTESGKEVVPPWGKRLVIERKNK
jgi:predicted metal-dependent peptidase